MSKTRTAGFTLVEVLVTLAITSLIMLGLQITLNSTIFAHDDIAIDVAEVREGPALLDLIERDLRSLYTFNVRDGIAVQGQLERHLGRRGDRLDFLTCTNSSARLHDPLSPQDEPHMISTDITEVGYRVRVRSDHGDFLELWRREDPSFDDKPFEGGDYQLLHNRITRFEIAYLDKLGEDAEELEEWDMQERKVLPAALRISLTLQSQPELVGEYANARSVVMAELPYQRTIPLSPSFAAALKVRPARPVPIDENDAETGAGGGAGGGADDPTLADGAGGDGGGGPGGGGDDLMGSFVDGVAGGHGDPAAPPTRLDGLDQFGDNLFSIVSGDELTEAQRDELDELLSEYEELFGGG
jgi:type II secretion system protein J